MNYYDKTEPSIGDIVFVKIVSTTNGVGAYCQLIEYNNMNGLIVITELDRRMRNSKFPMKVDMLDKFNYNTIYCSAVIAVNKKNVSFVNETGEEITESNISVDLSYRQVDPNIREQLINQFEYILSIKKLCDEFCFVTKQSQNDIYPLTLWKITKPKKFDVSWTIEKLVKYNTKEKYDEMIRHPEIFCDLVKENFPIESEVFLENMKSRITHTSMTVEKYFDLIIYENDGINKLKAVLNINNTDANVSIECVSSPTYKITVVGYSLDECNKKVKDCLNEIKLKTSSIISSLTEKKHPKEIEREKNNSEIKYSNDSIEIIKQQEFHIRPVNINPTNQTTSTASTASIV